jgi:SAM-dependent methyltransferase
MSAVLRKKEAGWKFVAYTESHRTPLTYMMDLYKKQPSIPIVRTIVQRFMTRLYEKNVHPEFAAFHKNIMETEKTEYKVNFWTKLSFIGPKIINSFAKITGKKTIPKSYIPGLIPCLNGRGFMEKDLNGISTRFVDESAKMEGISLDVGCAYGIATLAALKGGSEVVACDMDQAHLNILLKETPENDKPRLTTKKGTLPGVDFKNQSFVAIHCSRCLHFLVPEELKLTLEKMYNWLQPGGKIYLITDTCFSGPWKQYLPEFDRRKAEGDPFPGFIEDALKCLPVSKLPKGMTPHMNCLDPDTLARECKLAGFEIIEADFLGPARSEAKYAKDHAGIIAIKN